MPQPLIHRLRHLDLRFAAPAAGAEAVVASIWSITHPAGAAACEYFYPDGNFGVLLPLDGDVRIDGEPLVAPVLDGTLRQARRLDVRGAAAVVGVRLRPGVGGGALGEHRAGQRERLTPLVDPVWAAVTACLRACEDPLTARGGLDEALAPLGVGDDARCTTAEIARSIADADGGLRIATIARDVGLSERQVERLFAQQLGLSPKQYSRIVRVDVARKRLREPDAASIADVAHALGFADQAHLTRDFAAHLRVTPGQYRRRRARLIADARRAAETPRAR